MKIHEGTYKKLLRDAGGSFGTKKWMPEAAERHRVGGFRYWDKFMQEGDERNGEHVDIEAGWPAENWWERGRWERGGVRHRNKDERSWEEKRKSRYWTQTTVHARRCGETRRGSLDIETAWMREVVKRHRWGGLYGGTRYKTKWTQEVAGGHCGYWSKMNAGSGWGAPGRKLRYWNKMRKTWRGYGGI